MAEQWVHENLNIDDYWLGYNVIDWGNHYFTEIDVFLKLFSDIIEQALKDGKDVRQAIANSEDGKSFADLLLN